MPFLLLILLTLCYQNILQVHLLPISSSHSSSSSSCYYEPYYKQLTCKCSNQNTRTALNLRLQYFVKDLGNQVTLSELNQQASRKIFVSTICKLSSSRLV